MKKLEILILVLAMASMAQGKMLYFAPNVDGTDVMYNTTVTIKVYGDWDAVAFGIGAVKITSDLPGDFSNITLGTVNSGFDLLKNAGTLRDGSQSSVYLTAIFGVRDVTSPHVPAYSTWYTFSLTTGATAGNHIYIDDYKGTVYDGAPRITSADGTEIADPAMSILTLNIIPEPMTIALLGLGGLFLRRRK